MSKTNPNNPIGLFYLLSFSYLVLCNAANADSVSGHLKYRAQSVHYPSDSVFRQQSGPTAYDHSTDLRLQWSAQKNSWSLQLDYQLLGIAGDGVELANNLNSGVVNNALISGGFPDDDQRLWDLTHRFSDQDRHLLLQRLDRAHLTYAGERSVLRIGRQVLSWGNGLIYNPMDFFNPFDPAAVDTEYKAGDDMVYGQYLFANGSDLQAVYVARRDDNKQLTSDVASVAMKYHGWWGEQEWDLLLAQHYDETLMGAGVGKDIGGAVWRADLLASEAKDSGWTTSLVTNISYSWNWWDKNISGIGEYYYNGFGENKNNLAVDDVKNNQPLMERLNRGELYTLGRHYLAASMTIELTPLINLTPSLFFNLSDQSRLWQLVLQYDPSQNIQLLAAINLPTGSSGSEFGGLDTSLDNIQLSQDLSASLQIAWYF